MTSPLGRTSFPLLRQDFGEGKDILSDARASSSSSSKESLQKQRQGKKKSRKDVNQRIKKKQETQTSPTECHDSQLSFFLACDVAEPGPFFLFFRHSSPSSSSRVVCLFFLLLIIAAIFLQQTALPNRQRVGPSDIC
ncbi:hypothetical protein QOT17_010339 [Balamuthia mandrillaris]